MSGAGNWSIFLKQLSVELLRNPDRRSSLERDYRLNECEATQWLGYSGSNAEEIDSLEARLGTLLPTSYREFLSISNGWGPINFEVEQLYPAKKVAWWKETDKEFIDAWMRELDAPMEVPDEKYYVYGPEQMTGIFRDADMYDCLQISPNNSSVILLNPNARPIKGEWEAWWFATWYPGAVRYRSFYELMQDQLKSAREWQPDPVDLNSVPRLCDGPKRDEPQ